MNEVLADVPEDLVGIPHWALKAYVEGYNRAVIEGSDDPEAAGRKSLQAAWDDPGGIT